MTEQDIELLDKIREHLFKLHAEWQARGDGGGKMCEGEIRVIFTYPTWFEANDYRNDEPVVSCSVYSYLFGPHRLHEFNSLREAWEAVKRWPLEDENL